MTDLEVAWAAVHDNTPPDWYVGRPYFDERQNRWERYAFDASETPVAGKRSREWTAVGPTETALCAGDGAMFVGATGGPLAQVAALGHRSLDPHAG